MNLQSLLNCGHDQLSERVEKLLLDRKDLGKKLKQRQASDGPNVNGWLKNAKQVGDYLFVLELVDAGDMENLKRLGDKLLSKIKSGVGVLFYTTNEKLSAVVVVDGEAMNSCGCDGAERGEESCAACELEAQNCLGVLNLGCRKQ